MTQYYRALVGIKSADSVTKKDKASREEYHVQLMHDLLKQWNSVLPETGDVSEADAISLAQSALLEQFGVTPDKLAMMETEVYCQIDYCFFDEPTRSWFVRFVDNVDDYQVYLRASDGTVTDISNQGSVLGAG